MQALLIRIAVDHSYGRWNAPVDEASGQFGLPIPENPNVTFHPGLERRYPEFVPALNEFCDRHDRDLYADLGFPRTLLERAMHLDPDFAALTYGDNGANRGAQILNMSEGDVLAFYAGLRPIAPSQHRLLYALVGLYVVEEVVRVPDVPADRWCENAHTHKSKRGESDIVVRAKPGVSGRLERCIPIGELRDRSYRVRRDVLDAWGGLSVKDGFIQRSAVPPAFLEPARFYDWFMSQEPVLIRGNNSR